VTLIVHIGAPKTATSTLQNAFFPRHPGLFFLGKEVDGKRGWKGWRSTELQDLMLALERENLKFQPDLEKIAALVKSISVEAAGRQVVISSEDLCLFSSVDSLAKLRRIQKLFGSLGPIRIVLAVREQLSLWKSIYTTEHRGEMMKVPGTRQNWYPSFDQFLDIHFRYVCGAVLESFRFGSTVKHYEALVGADNVYVYAYDAFLRDPVTQLKALCQFIGIDENDECLRRTAVTHENTHYSARSYAFVKIRSYFKGVRRLVPAALKNSFYRWLDGGASFKFEPSAEARRRIKDYYRADNEMLFTMRGIRL
jgi:hypothetical protein